MTKSLEVRAVPSIHITPSLDSQGSQKDSANKRYSASEFAKDGIKVDRWLWERATIRLAHLCDGVPSIDDVTAQINSMNNQYQDLFYFAWPAKWSHLDPSLVPCDPAYKGILQLLFHQYKAFKEDEKNLPIRELAEPEFLTLETRLSPFLFSVSMSRTCVQQTLRGLKAYEMETRMSFDLLIGLFWCSPGSEVADSYFKEAKLRLPLKNLDTPSMNALATTWIKLAVYAIEGRTLGDVGYEAGATVANTAWKSGQQRPEEELDESGLPNKDPEEATCDGLGGTFIEYTDARDQATTSSSMHNRTQEGAKHMKQFVSIWAAFRRESTKSTRLASCPGFIEKEGTEEGSRIEHHRECLACPARTGFPPMQSSVESPAVEVPKKFFPALFVEYKRSPGSENVATARHQCQLYCVTGVEALHELGVDDYPVYGVTVNGTCGSIMMAWKASKWEMGNEKICGNIIIDHNLPFFDLAEPLDAYRFSLAIHRIYLSQGKLRDLIDAKKLINDERKMARVE